VGYPIFDHPFTCRPADRLFLRSGWAADAAPDYSGATSDRQKATAARPTVYGQRSGGRRRSRCLLYPPEFQEELTGSILPDAKFAPVKAVTRFWPLKFPVCGASGPKMAHQAENRGVEASSPDEMVQDKLVWQIEDGP